MKEIRVGMIGYKFMGKAHSLAYRNVPFFFPGVAKPVRKAIAGRNKEGVKQAAEELGWESYETDWRKMIERDDIDLIDIVTPNNSHAEMAIAAAEAGKHVICEKPLSLNAEQAERMLEAVTRNKVIHMISHNYRFAPAVQYAKKLIQQGRLGRIYHVRATYLQDWIMDPDFPIAWRLKKEVTGSGALGDIGAHIIDLSRFLVGEISEVVGSMETFIKERPIDEMSDKKEKVDVDDAASFIAKFENGAMGVFEATRFAAGNRNRNSFEINAEFGSIKWDLENMNNLHVYLTEDDKGLQGFRVINCTEEVHPYADAYWPAGHIIGYEHTFVNLMSELMKAISNNNLPSPNFYDGLQNQLILDAIERSSAEKRWITISKKIEQLQ
ncbi:MULTISPECIES: Gfo/Idh/MocA family protein [Bacillaceae]|uniref:Gfo/Idh/MocA family protein n=1 Tax=Bacillaceae TaxID=186817 RepID=UPI001C60B15C|nr:MULTISPECIES: Gfo/Idh/MocA family oxidoreductase [Bacillaceae]